MKRCAVVIVSIASCSAAAGQGPPLLPERTVAALESELSGETAKRHLEFLARHHRMRGSSGFRAAAEHIAGELRRYGLQDATILQFPADGETMFGTQKARPAWDAEFAELWELAPADEGWIAARRLASWEAMPVTLAQDSESAEVTADLVDVGAGTEDSDYEGLDVAGKLVLTSSQPRAVAALAVERHGAAGIISYAQNQRSAWWKEDENLVRWGHLDSFSASDTFGFMISLKQARAFRERLGRGERVRLRAEVRAGRFAGHYDIVTATIPGSDPGRRDEEIAFSCHLDHQRPGANDNASGCVTILEVARTLTKLIGEGRLAPPARTLRFIWPPEIEGSTVLLNARPDLAARIRAVIHLDMVGGGPQTKAVFHVTRSPASLPSFVNDVAETFAAYLNEQSDAFAGGDDPPHPFVAPEGGKEALQALPVEFSPGSDHQVYTDSSFGIPAIYLNDWPDRFIHTNGDTPANIDPTKLKRAGFIAAASGWYLAGVGEADAAEIWELLQRGALRRSARLLERRAALEPSEAVNLTRFHWSFERALLDSIERLAPLPGPVREHAETFLSGMEGLIGPGGSTSAGREAGSLIYRRKADLKGPLSVFGYDYLDDHYGAEQARALKLPRHSGPRGDGGVYAYEALNFVDGRRTVREIRDALSAELGPVPLDFVAEYLAALASIGVIRPLP